MSILIWCACNPITGGTVSYCTLPFCRSRTSKPTKWVTAHLKKENN